MVKKKKTVASLLFPLLLYTTVITIVMIISLYSAYNSHNQARVETTTPDPRAGHCRYLDYDQYKQWINNTVCQIKRRYNESKSPCECWNIGTNGSSGQFEGWHPITSVESPPHFGELELKHTELQPGGAWSPPDCQARHQVAIIVPFRDRESHLRLFLSIIHPMLQRQQLSYRIIVVEQAAPRVFNKAAMMNIGFWEARQMSDFDCFIFHDVDMLPEDDRNLYICSDQPRHVGSHVDKFKYQVAYDGIFGGATAFTEEQFRRANGFSNVFYGWGGEDDDMYNRVISAGMNIVRYPGSVAKYHMIKHKSDSGNPYNQNSYVAWKVRPRVYQLDGINSLRYKKRMYEYRPLYTWIYAEVPDPSQVRVLYFDQSLQDPEPSGQGKVQFSIWTYIFSIILTICLYNQTRVGT